MCARLRYAPGPLLFLFSDTVLLSQVHSVARPTLNLSSMMTVIVAETTNWLSPGPALVLWGEGMRGDERGETVARM